MIDLIFAVLLGVMGCVLGVISCSDHYEEKCIAKYADMPHSKVKDYCKTLLKFEKEAK
jgi:hypothetical protein